MYKDELFNLKTLPYSFKGYELYAWVENGCTKYKLMSGSNAEKSSEKIFQEESTLDESGISISIESVTDLLEILKKMPLNVELVINTGEWWNKSRQFNDILPVTNTDELESNLIANEINFIK